MKEKESSSKSKRIKFENLNRFVRESSLSFKECVKNKPEKWNKFHISANVS